MRYLAVIVMCCCVFLNFMIYSGYAGGSSGSGAAQALPAQAGEETAESGVPGLSGPGGARAFPFAENGNTDAPRLRQIANTMQTTIDRVSLQESVLRPKHYRGIYLHNYSARIPSILSEYVTKAKAHGLNAFVLDMQDSVYFNPGEIPASNIEICLSNEIWPIARIVVFPYGLKEYPVPQAFIDDRMELAAKAVELGFREIQFDYIRFEDTGRFAHLGHDARYQVVEGFLGQARERFGPQGITITADVFGRVTLNRNDIIGQRLEGLDKVVDVILPMTYPSHYGWDAFSMANPYYTQHNAAVLGKERLSQAELVLWVQGFEMKVAMSGLSLPVYIAHQIQAIEDAGVSGWIVWNAAQSYAPTWEALRLLAGSVPVPGLARAREVARARIEAAAPKEKGTAQQ